MVAAQADAGWSRCDDVVVCPPSSSVTRGPAGFVPVSRFVRSSLGGPDGMHQRSERDLIGA